jgi:glycosyltransferase involved in cell wall biosynthesis
MLPNVHGTQPKRTAANSTAHGIDQTRSLVLAHVGDWSYAKGADRSTEVVEKLRDKLCKTGVVVQFVIAGHILDVERPPESVHLGYLDSDRLWSELMAYEPQFLLLMSRGDRWGFVVSEAMARGVVPVVTPEVGAAADLVRPLGSHLICNSGAEAADAILSLFGDRTEFERLSNQARSIIESRTSRWAVQEFARGLSRLEGGAFATEVA